MRDGVGCAVSLGLGELPNPMFGASGESRLSRLARVAFDENLPLKKTIAEGVAVCRNEVPGLRDPRTVTGAAADDDDDTVCASENGFLNSSSMKCA